MNRIYFLFLICLPTFFFGQVNLVPNPGFEICAPCPTITGQYNLCNNWLNCNGNIGSGLWGTPDYYNTCGTFNPTYNPVPPNVALGTCSPNTGNAMMGLVCYDTPYPNYREYLSAKLNCTITPGNTYTVSFYITAGTNPKVKYQTSHFGVYLSSGMPPQSGFAPILVTPQYEITTIITNTSWVQHTFTINPVTPMDYITLGCFRTDAVISNNLATPGAANPYSNYYIDDISVKGNVTIPVNFVTQSVTCGSTNNGSATVTPLSPGSYTYNWQPGNMTTQSAGGLTTGIYTVNISNACATNVQTVSIGQQPTPSLTVSSVSVCANSNVTINANATGGTPGYTYLWTSGGTSSTINVNSPSTSVITCTATDAGGCKAIANGTVTITNPSSSFNFIINACNGQLTTTNTSTGSGNFTWDFGDGSTSSLSSPVHTYTTSGNYTLTLTAGSGTCIAVATKTVIVSPVSINAFTHTTNLCDSTIAVANNSTGSGNFLWQFGDGTTSSVANPGPHIYSNSGTYTVLLITNPGTACADTSKSVVNIVRNTIAAFSVLSNSCSKLITTANSSSLASSYFWQFGNGSTSALVNPSYSYPATGTYSITLYTNPGTSCADTTVKVITVSDPPLALFTFSTSPCSGRILFTNNSLNSTSYLWNFGDGQISIDSDPIHIYKNQGNYHVTLVANPGSACADTIQLTVPVKFTPIIADFSYVNPEYSYDAQFTNLSSNASSFVWDFSDGTTSNFDNPAHTFTIAGEFNVCMQATNNQGCSDLICKTVSIKPDWTLYVPNTFSPNGDGLNDIFNAYGTNIISFKMMIFDRWGEQLFYADSMHKGWDAMFRGKQVQEGTYVWKISATDYNHKAHELTGHINLIR